MLNHSPTHRVRLRLRTRAVAVIGVLVLAGAGLAGCSGSESESNGTPAVELYVGTDAAFGPLYYAEKEGLFKKQGVEVKFNLFASGTEAIEAYRSGRGGLVGSGDLPAIAAWQKGDTVGLAPLEWDTTTFSFLVSSKIKSPQDLVGKTIATKVGSSGSLYLHNYFNQQGLTGKVKVVDLSPADMPAALANGDIAGFVWTTPTIIAAMKAAPDAHKLVDGSKGYLINRVMMSGAATLISERPDVVQKIVNAVTAGCAGMRTDPQARQKIATFLKIDIETVRQASQGVNFDCAFDQAFVKDMTEKAGTGQVTGILTGGVDWTKMFNSSFLAKVDPNLAEGATTN